MLVAIGNIIIQTVIAIVMMVIMVLMMLGVNRLFGADRHTDEKKSADRLRHDLKDSPNVISDDNIFHEFLTSLHGEKEKK